MKPAPSKRQAQKAWQRRRAEKRLPIVGDDFVDAVPRPRRRGDCLPGGSNAARPCPYVGCRYHLYLDVRRTGSIKFNFRKRPVDRLAESCALDLADRGGHTLDQIGTIMGFTRERVRQIVEAAVERMQQLMQKATRGGV